MKLHELSGPIVLSDQLPLFRQASLVRGMADRAMLGHVDAHTVISEMFALLFADLPCNQHAEG
jgi:hypothetical protein